MFGISFGELMLIATVALLVVGPQKLPQMLRTLGNWIARMRRMMTDVRSQSGIDDILRAEGLDGGLSELRSLVKGAGGLPLAARAFQGGSSSSTPRRPETFTEDRSREYPVEGPDAQGALPEDLLPKPPKVTPAAGAGAEAAAAVPPQPIPARTPTPPRSGPPRPDRPRTIPPPGDAEKAASNGPQPALEAVSGGRQAP